MPLQKYTTKTGLWSVLPNVFIIVGVLLFLAAVIPYLRDEIWYALKSSRGQVFVLDGEGQQDSIFARYLSSSPISMHPVSREFGIVIEKIGVNAPVVKDVPVSDTKAYQEALQHGIAHASTSAYPSTENGNVYLFAHSSIHFWALGKYAEAFNLLRKLEAGDKVHVFYEGQDFVYQVVSKEIFKGFNTYPLNRTVIQPVLTLQTCDPPGTTLNRLVVTCKLLEVK